MTITPVAHTGSIQQNTPIQKSQPAPQQPEDSVKLSAAALKAGDVDHDGDSH